MTSGSTFCSGMVGLVKREFRSVGTRSVGTPNNPANTGNNTGAGRATGEERLKSRIRRPKTPERTKTNAANNTPGIDGTIPFSPSSVIRVFSVAIIISAIAMRTHTIASCNVVYNDSGGPMMKRRGKRRIRHRRIAP